MGDDWKLAKVIDIVNSFDKIPTSESPILSESPHLSNDVRNHHRVKIVLFPSIESLNKIDSVHIPSINQIEETMALGMIDVAMSNICVWVNEDSIKDIAFVEHIFIVKKGFSSALNGMDLAQVIQRRAFYNNVCWIISEFPIHLHEMFPKFGICHQYECYSQRMYCFIVSFKKHLIEFYQMVRNISQRQILCLYMFHKNNISFFRSYVQGMASTALVRIVQKRGEFIAMTCQYVN